MHAIQCLPGIVCQRMAFVGGHLLVILGSFLQLAAGFVRLTELINRVGATARALAILGVTGNGQVRPNG